MKLHIWFALHRVHVMAGIAGAILLTGGLTTAAVINRAAGGVTLEPGPELDAAIEEAEQSLDNNYKQLDNSDPTVPQEPTKGTDYQPVKETGPGITAPTTTNNTTTTTQEPDQYGAVKSPVHKGFGSYAEMEAYYMGQCPQPAEQTSGYQLSPLLALGLTSTGLIENATTWQRVVELEWGSIKQSYVTGWFKPGQESDGPLDSVERFGIDMGGKNGRWSNEYGFSNYSGYEYFLRWSDKTVYAKETGTYHQPYTTEKLAEIDALAVKMTAYIRDLDARFNAKCGEYPL